ncbi:serine/threonine-protein kinase PknK [Polyangium aurulentum]|uniref:serine/threonine-protein kinase n=1 Tax=Polyangium aurulentum TaxID=2567896 RepID=UPI0010AEE426|nr:serine/threonine-protein kinase [Polyangium aurulentum]UQA56958.1 protein kinase [Polyangium aurulentum]
MHAGALIADRFYIERPAGSGGMGTVYRARDRLSGMPVALKLAAADDEPLHARALAEADALAALDHPAIVRLVAHGVAPDGRPFLAMEWLEGEDLARRLERAPLTVAEVVRLGARVAAALASAHARGVVHRDLKPSNLFLPGGEPAEVKVVDFGIARFAHAEARLTATGSIIGTPGYMAPEQASGEGVAGPAADLFALGAVLFECLAGHPAFSGASPIAVLAKVLLEAPPRLDAERSDLAPALVTLVADLLAKRPEDRPDAGAAAAALSALLPALAGGATLAPAPAPQAITGDEQRFACVLLVRPAPQERPATPVAPAKAGGGGDATLPAGDLPPLMAPERAALERLRAIVGPRGGRADGLASGDLVASWLDPGVPRDQATRAARAALLARKRFPGAALAVGSGMTERDGALPLGSALEHAAALLDADGARGDAVPLDEVTAGLLDARFQIAPAGAGHALLAERGPDEQEVRLVLGRAVPCVGRERELRLLLDTLDECLTEPVARAVLVTAPAGTGKSRLRAELLRFVRLRGDVEVWVASADELGAGSPFALLGEALERAAGTGPGDPLEGRHDRLGALVARNVPEEERARVTVFLGEITGAPFAAATHPALAAARREPALMAKGVRRAWLDLLAAETAARPVLLVLEDLHWGDAPSVKLVDAALAELHDRPFMVLALARPGVAARFPDLWSMRGGHELRLAPLPRRAAAQLVRHALPSADDALVARLVDRAEGNGLCLEELVRAAAAGRGEALPETVAAMVQVRLGELSSDERRLLRAASAFGEVFWKRAVLALLGAGQRPTALADSLEALVAREILVRRRVSRFPGEEELAFRHALLRDGAYATFTADNRRLAHRLAAAWLEGAGESDPLLLAAHYERGGEAARAAAWYCRTAERTLAGNDPHGAIAHAEKALALGPDEAVRLRVLQALAQAMMFAGRLAEAERWTEGVLAAVPRGSAMGCDATYAKLVLCLLRGDAELASLAMTAAEGVEATPENAGALLQLLGMVWGIFCFAGQVEGARPYLARAEAIVARFGASIDPGSLGTLCFRRWAFWLLTDFEPYQALREAEGALHLYELAGDRTRAGQARAGMGAALWSLGAFQRAEVEARRAVEEAGPGVHSGLVARAYLARLLAERGAFEEAAREALRARAESQAAGDGMAETAARLALAYVLKRQGAPAGAEGELRDTRPVTRSNQSNLHAGLAEARLAQGDAAEALKMAREVLAPEGWICTSARLKAREVEVRALLALGEREAARAGLGELRAEMVAIAARIEDEALRAAFLTRGPLCAPILALAAQEGVGAAGGC